eukprot:COSAG03_NODE_169_length_11255_cov_5.793385_2_plen_118_part_00
MDGELLTCLNMFVVMMPLGHGTHQSQALPSALRITQSKASQVREGKCEREGGREGGREREGKREEERGKEGRREGGRGRESEREQERSSPNGSHVWPELLRIMSFHHTYSPATHSSN